MEHPVDQLASRLTFDAFRVIAVESDKLLHFDGKTFFISVLKCLAITKDGIKPLIKKPTIRLQYTKKKIHLNSKASNCIFQCTNTDVFKQVYTLTKANQILLKLKEIHDSFSNVGEQKHCLVKQTYDSLSMLHDEIEKRHVLMT